MAAINIAGRRFGRLTAVKHVGQRKWLFKCDCGADVLARKDDVSRHDKPTVSCGCQRREGMRLRKTSHGMSHTRTYRSWKEMVARCCRSTSSVYSYYGGRGISVCDRWLGEGGFAAFYADMGERPEGHSLDRIAVNGNYGPENCRWATAKQQAGNRRNSKSHGL